MCQNFNLLQQNLLFVAIYFLPILWYNSLEIGSDIFE